MQLSYVLILGYSFDSTKVAKPIRPPILKGILEHLGAIGTGGTKKQTAEMMIPQERVVVLTRFDKASDFEFWHRF